MSRKHHNFSGSFQNKLLNCCDIISAIFILTNISTEDNTDYMKI